MEAKQQLDGAVMKMNGGFLRLGGVLIVLLTLFSYLPALGAGFIWDDDSHLTQNPCIVGPLGLKAIWTSSRGTYYPLVLTSFWGLHKLVGLAPFPYHLVNVLVHAASAVVLWRVLLRLGIPGAWLGATLWALHPVMVQSVAWITELKNTQSCFFYLLSILFFLKSDDTETTNRRWHYCLAILLFAMAITSKTSVVMLPVILALCLWWRRGELRWRDLPRLGPFLLISAVASIWTIYEQKFESGALGAIWAQTWMQRLAIAGSDIWFYLGKILWPHPLIFIYPRWKIDPAQIPVYFPALAAVAGLLFLWWKRNGALRPAFFAGAYFVVSLFPVLGFFDAYFFRFSFVSDHFQYLASMGPLVLSAAGIVIYSSKRTDSWLRLALPLVLIATLGTLTWRQSKIYKDAKTIWRTTLARNPACYLAHSNLGLSLEKEGKRAEAITHFEAAIQAEPRFVEAHTNLGAVLLVSGKLDQAMDHLREAVELKPDHAKAHCNLANGLVVEGKVDEAITHYYEALRLDPNYPEAHFNLAYTLATLGRRDEAAVHFTAVLRLNPNDAEAKEQLRALGVK